MGFSSNVSLRRIEREDIPLLFQWNTNKELGYFYAFTNNKSRAELEAIYESYLNDNSIVDFLILHGEEQRPVGFCGLKDIDWVDRRAEIFVSVCDKDARKNGVATNGLLLVAIHAFYELNLNRIYGKIASHNKRSLTLMKECGLVHEGTLRQMLYYNNMYHDIEVFGLLKNEAAHYLKVALEKTLAHHSSGCTEDELTSIRESLACVSQGDNAHQLTMATA